MLFNVLERMHTSVLQAISGIKQSGNVYVSTFINNNLFILNFKVENQIINLP